MMNCIERWAVLWCVGAVAGILSMSQGVGAQEAKPSKQTFTYKTVDKCVIHADVYGASAAVPRPVVIWIHGGALIIGHRGQIDAALL